MKICFIYRKPLKGRHSIEKVFKTLSAELNNVGCETINILHVNSIRQTINNIKRTNADIYHVTGDVHYLSLFLPRNKTLLTIHDVGAFKNHPKSLKKWMFFIIWFILPVHYLKKITVVSDLTKKDLMSLTKLNPHKISVIENPLTLSVDFSLKKINNKPKILQIGSGPHKNLRKLIEAVKDLECSLIIVGKPSVLEIDLMASSGVEYEIHYGIPDKELKDLYEEIDILFFASLSEGFGLPILEAQAKGRPVITSNLSPMKEVSGGHAKLVNPSSTNEIREAIEDIIKHSLETEYMVKMGKENVSNYDTKIICNKYMDTYNFLTAGI